jgi:hypothetical protein
MSDQTFWRLRAGGLRARVVERGRCLHGRPPWVAWRRWLVDEGTAAHPRATMKDFVGECDM